MSRDLPTGLAAAFASAKIFPCFLVEVEWPGGTVYVWNGYHSLSWGGHTWLPTGDFGGISNIKENRDLTANGVSLTLSGIPSNIIGEAMRNDTQGRPVKIYFGTLTTTGFVIDPYLQWSGLIDAISHSDDGKTATLTVNCETEMIDNRSAARRYTHEDQQLDFPGDTAFRFVAGMPLTTLTWGRTVLYGATFPPAGVAPGKIVTLQ